MRNENNYDREEYAIKPLIDAANSNQWKEALNILFINGALLSFSDDIPTPFLIGVNGEITGIAKVMDLHNAKFNTELSELLPPILEKIMPPIFSIVAQSKTELEEDQVRTVTMFAMEAIQNEKNATAIMDVVGEFLVKGLFSFSSVLATWIFPSYYL